MKTIHVCALIGCLVPSNAFATAGLPTIDNMTIQGKWESIDWEHSMFVLMQVENGRAKVVMTGGSQQAEIVLQSEKVSVSHGNVSFIARDVTSGMAIRVSGRGRAAGAIGILRCSLQVLDTGTTNFKGMELAFLKAAKTSRAAQLAKAEMRAKRLLMGRYIPPSRFRMSRLFRNPRAQCP